MIEPKNIIKTIILVICIVLLCTSLSGCISNTHKINFYEKKLENEKAEKRLEAIEKLYEIEDIRVFYIFADLLENDENADVQLAAFNAIVSANYEKIVDALKTALSNKNVNIRIESAKKLGEYATVDSLDALLFALKDSDIQVRDEADASIKKIAQDSEVLEEMMDIFIDPEKEKYIAVAIDAVNTNIENETIDYDIILLAAYPRNKDKPKISQIAQILDEEILTNENFQNHVFKNFLSGSKDIAYTSKAMYDVLRRKGMEEDALKWFVALYNLENYDKIPYAALHMGEAIPEVYSFKNGLMELIFDKLKNDDTIIADRVRNSLAYLYFYLGNRNPGYFYPMVKGDVSEISGFNKDFLMSLAYSDGVVEGKNASELVKEGEQIWNTQKEDLPVIDCLIKSQKYVYDANYTDLKGPSSILSIIARDNSDDVFGAIFTEFEEYIDSDSEYAEYLIELSKDVGAEEYMDGYFKSEYSNLRKESKNTELKDGYQGVIILYYDYNVSDTVGIYDSFTSKYLLYKYWEMPYNSRAYKLSQVRYVIDVYDKHVFLGRYINTDIYAFRVDIGVMVVDKLTGEVISKKIFRGENPSNEIDELPRGNAILGEVDWETIDEYVMEQVEELTKK